MNESLLQIGKAISEPMLQFSVKNETATALIKFTGEGKDLVFETGRNFIFNGGWVLSWTAYLFGGLILALIIWNIILTMKIRKFAVYIDQDCEGDEK